MALIEINHSPSPRELRQFAGIWFPAFCGMVGAAVFFRVHAQAVGVAIWVLGGAGGLIGLARPRLIKPLFIGLSYATYPIGWVVSYLLIGVIYYGLMTPIGLLLRLTGRDPLRLKRDLAVETWWVARDPDAKPERYFKQY